MTTTKRRKRTIGEAFRKLDAAQDHISHSWAMLCRDVGLPERTAERPDTRGFKPGTAIYHAAAVFEYAREAWEILRDHVPGDWQLCPYEDCCWGCGVDHEGYFICPHCGRYFVASYSDSDYEDVKLRRHDPAKDPAKPAADIAYDFGPTWATPDKKERHED